MAALPSNLRVFVTFKDSTVFAGDNIEATITFKNVETKQPKPERPALSLSQPNGSANVSMAPSRAPSQAPSLAPSRPGLSRHTSVASNARKTSHLSASRHRPATSLTIVDSAGARSRGSVSAAGGVNIADPSPKTPTHGRSVSIVSLGSDASRGERMRGSQSSQTPVRPNFRHGRSASVQISSPSQRIGRSPSLTGRSTLPSPLSAVASPRYRSAESYFLKNGPLRNGVVSGPESAVSEPNRGQLQQSFRFPPSSGRPLPHRHATTSSIGYMRTSGLSPRPMSPPSADTKEGNYLEIAPVSRILSLSSEAGTPRSSGDFYSLSNRSDETLASENQAQPSSRLLQRPAFNRSPSNLNPALVRKGPETLMMGYAQISGAFMLDGSLVNAAPFEEVKRKAVVGGQGGGGVVGLEQKKQDSGLFGSFGWSNIGESLGGLLRGGEQSSIKEMKSIATSKSIPLLSTPKSILFVDLRLSPGESRSYSYSFPLPRGLPPSHRGRAIKILYQLIIGTQRPSSSKLQHIRQVEVPFRVFCSVNSQGDILGHDLMNPHIILHDQAKTSSLENTISQPANASTQSNSTTSKSSGNSFAMYIEHLLNTTKGRSNSLLSPTGNLNDLSLSPSLSVTQQSLASSPSVLPLPSGRNLIDNALRLAASPATGLPTSFTIARSGNTIAVLTLSRPALRLGDTLHIALDFGNAAIPCYALDVSLETIETVDPSLAIRSAASVERATRRVWDKRAEHGFALGWCGRWGGRLKIPWNATPGFDTTGVSCKWVVRVEIVVGVNHQAQEDASFPHGSEPDTGDRRSDNDDAASDEELDSTISEEGSELANERGEMHIMDPNTTSLQAPRRRSTSSARRRSAQIARARTRLKTIDRARLLLEEIGQDERGRHLAARQRLLCESFDVCVPLRVLGANSGNTGGGVFGVAITSSGRQLEGEYSESAPHRSAYEGLAI